MKNQRLMSLDFMRGLIMVLLALESTELYFHIAEITPQESFGHYIIAQFFHNNWEGLHFWDLIQPAFMFMAGVSMAYSLTKQRSLGTPWNQQFIKILKRSSLLIFWGIFKRISSPEWFSLSSLDLTDILTQLAFTTLIAFFLFNLRIRYQLFSCIAILLLTDLVYRFFHVPNFDQGYSSPGYTFGNYVDWILFNQGGGSYVFINWIPTAVHTIAGTIIGKILIQSRNKVYQMLLSGLVLLSIGYGLDWTGITPIIKPIASSAFTIASLGYCILILTAIYWWIDIKQHQKYLLFFQVVGMNSIFIYLLCDIVGRNWLNNYTHMIVYPVFNSIGIADSGISILASLCTFALEWSICYFLYKKNIFFKL